MAGVGPSGGTGPGSGPGGPPGLRRAVGLPTVIATSAGMALATVSLTAAVQIGLGLPGAAGWAAVLGAGVISLLAGFCFSELVGMFPTAAGIKLFVEKAFGEKVALVAATLYVSISVLIVGSEAYILARVLHHALPGISPAWWVFGFLTLMALVNLRGIALTGWAQDVTTFGLVLAIIGVSGWALLRPGAPPVELGLGGATGFSLAQALALGVFLYLGFEWVTPLAEEVHDVRQIPLGMLGGLAILAVVYGLLHVGMLTWVPKERLAGTPIPHILFGEAVLGRAGLLLMAAVSALASVTSFNAGLMTASRFLYAMGRDGAAPPALTRIHPIWATPWAAILALYGLCAAMAGFVLWTGNYKLFIYLGAAVECGIFVIMALSVIRLRRTMPAAVRRFRLPGGIAVAWFVAVAYGALLLLIFVPDPQNPADAAHQYGALGVLAAATLLVLGYVQVVVPRLRARLARARAETGRHRPRRPDRA